MGVPLRQSFKNIMARSVEEIENEIYKAKENEGALVELNSTSKVAVWRLWVYIIAFVIQSLEKSFELHKADIDERLSRLKPHTARWYREKALAFQYGFNLLAESDLFDNRGKSEEQIAASKVVKYAAVTEGEGATRLIVKIAGEKDGKLSQLSSDVEKSFGAYMARIKDAGVPVTVINYLPDQLKLHLEIVRDALVLDKNGTDITSGEKPVRDAIEGFMKELPFDGELSVQKLVDKIQGARGVMDVALKEVQTRWIDPLKGSYGDWESINIIKVPESGYFAVYLGEDDPVEVRSSVRYILKSEL